MATPNIVPRADSEGGLGTASKYWGSAYIDLIYVGAGKMGRDADNLLDFSTDNLIYFRIGAGNEFLMANNMFGPAANDGAALGNSNYKWSDLFLADGAVINFNNGNVTLTHSNNALTLADGDALHFGTDNDLRLFHTSGESLVQNTVGHLYIQNTADDKDIIFSCDDHEGGVETYFFLDGSRNTSGDQSPYTIFPDGATLALGSDADLKLKHSGVHGFITNNTGDLTITNNTDDGDIIFKASSGTSAAAEHFRLDGGISKTVFYKDALFTDNAKANFGSNSQLTIKHDSSNAEIKTTVGNLNIKNAADQGDIAFQADNGSTGTTTYFYLDGSSATHDGSATTGLYTNWPDNSRISLGTSHDFQMYHTGTQTVISQQGAGNLVIQNTVNGADISFSSDDGSGGVTPYLTLDGNSVGITVSAPQGMVFTDGIKAKFGNNDDMEIYHDGSTSAFIHNKIGDLYIKNDEVDHDIYFQCDDGSGGLANYLILDGGEGHTIASKEINFADGVPATFGNSAGGDLEIKEQSGNSYISNFTGNLEITNNQDGGDIIFKSDDGSGGTTAYLTLDGGNTRITAHKSMRFDDSVGVQLGVDADLQVLHNGTNSQLINYTGNLTITNNADDADVIFQASTGTNAAETYFYLDGSAGRVLYNKTTRHLDGVMSQFGTSGDLQIYHDGTRSRIENNTGDLRIITNANQTDIVFQADNGSTGVATYFLLDGSAATHDGSATTALYTRWLDNSRISLGASHDLQIYHDGSNSHISDTGTGDLIITADNDLTFKDGSGNTMANMNASDSVELYFGNSKKFETAAGGIEVAGTIAGSSFRGVRKVVNSTTSNVASALSGQIYSFDDADGATVTLPDSGAGNYTGTTFEFVIKTTATSNSHKIILSDTTNEKFIGAVATIDTDNDNAATFYTPATSNKAITMNGTTTGITGSRIRITNIAADIWSVEGTILHTGNTATPFTNS